MALRRVGQHNARRSTDDSAARQRQQVRLAGLYSHTSPEEAADMVQRVLGFFRAYCRRGESNGESEPDE
jgi:hypothetical protein